MKHILLLLIALILTPLSGLAQMDTMLKVIAIKETGENPFERRTMYQFTEAAWSEVSDMPWSYVLKHPDWKDVHEEAERAAVKYVHIIIERLNKAGADVTPYAIAYCWRGGTTAYLKRAKNPTYHRYAVEASNLFFHYEEGFVTGPDGYVFYAHYTNR